MAFTVTSRHSANSDTGASVQTITTDSQTPTASSLLLFFSGVEGDTAPSITVTDPTGGSLTYTLVDKAGESPDIPYAGDAGFKAGAAMYRADIGSSPSAFAITSDLLTTTAVGWYAALSCDITGHSSSTPVQTKGGGATVNPMSSSASGTLTLTSTPATGNLVVVAIFSTADAGGAFTAPTVGGQAMTPVAAQNNAGYTHAGLWYREWTGAESSNVITSTDLGDNVGSYVIVAVEIPATGGGAGAPVEYAAPWTQRPPGRLSPTGRGWQPPPGLSPEAPPTPLSVAVDTATLTLTSQTPTANVGQPFVTAVSASGRYFVDQFGDPILVKGDSPWAILVNSSTASMTHYLETRASQGFNVVLLGLLGSVGLGGPSNTGATYDGVLPFVAGDPTVFNSTYWDRVDYFLSTAASLGISVMAYPIDGWNGVAGSGGLAQAWSTGTATAYGTALAARLAGHPNVFYATGGDFTNIGGGSDDDRFWAVFQGLAAGGVDRVKTIQFTLNSASLDSAFWDEKVAFNFVYSYALTYAMVETAYPDTNPGGDHIPALMGEAHYEAYSGITDLYLRSMVAWALTAGAPGEFYGHEGIWDADPSDANMITTAVAQVSAVRAAFEGLDGWWDLVPDYTSAFITAGRGTKGAATGDYVSGNTYVTGGKTVDGRLAVIYLPNAASAVTVDTTQMVGGYTATWVDPTNGATVAGTPGTSFSRGTANAAGGADWLLVLAGTSATGATIDPATLNLTGQTPSAAGTGAASQILDISALTLTGLDPTASGSGAATQAADPAALTLTGVDVTATAGPASVTLDTAALTLNGLDPTASGTGATSTTVDTAALQLGAQTPTPAGTGTTSQPLDPTVLTFTGIDVTPIGAGAATQTADVAVLALAGVEISAGGTILQAIDPAALTLGGVNLTASGTGSPTVTIDVAALTLIGVTPAALGSGVTAILADSATLSLSGPTPTGAGTGMATPTLVDTAVLTLTGVEVLPASLVPDPNPVTLTLRETGHTATVRATATRSTQRPSTHATARENRP